MEAVIEKPKKSKEKKSKEKKAKHKKNKHKSKEKLREDEEVPDIPTENETAISTKLSEETKHVSDIKHSQQNEESKSVNATQDLAKPKLKKLTTEELRKEVEEDIARAEVGSSQIL